jgi:hypothetical protein
MQQTLFKEVDMRLPKYLSPTSLGLFYHDREQFFYNYLCDLRSARPPQTDAMAVGSAFDAFVKSHLYKLLVGKGNPTFEFETIFEAQVEPHNRDEARRAGQETFDAYKHHGALADLMLDLNGCVGEPKFETTIEGIVEHQIGAVPFLGKPDIFFVTKKGARVIFDWKVNGYYSNTPPSPKPGYLNKLPGRDMHKSCLLSEINGFRINHNSPLETVDPSWANQTSIYAWLLGEAVGEKFITAIDQICVNKRNSPRTFTVAQHRTYVTEGHQQNLFESAVRAWMQIQQGHIFETMTLEQSQARCRTLTESLKVVSGDKAFNDLMS